MKKRVRVASVSIAAAATIAVVAVAVVAGVTSLSFYMSNSFASSTSLPTSSAASVSPSSATSLIRSTNQGMYEIIFQQVRNCPADTSGANDYLTPWAVLLSNGMNASQPPNQISAAENPTIQYGGPSSTYSTIVFLVPDGNYTYSVFPIPIGEAGGLTPNTGSVLVSGQNVTVDEAVNLGAGNCGYLITNTTAT